MKKKVVPVRKDRKQRQEGKTGQDVSKVGRYGLEAEYEDRELRRGRMTGRKT